MKMKMKMKKQTKSCSRVCWDRLHISRRIGKVARVHAPADDLVDFEKELARQTLISERWRCSILAGALGLAPRRDDRLSRRARRNARRVAGHDRRDDRRRLRRAV